jgi:TonB family protein
MDSCSMSAIERFFNNRLQCSTVEVREAESIVRDSPYIALVCIIVASIAESQANPGTLKPPPPPPIVVGTQAIPLACTKTNPPLWCATPPRVVSAPAPEVSKQAGAAETKGVCVLKMIVEADGSTSHIRVVNGLGIGLDEKAIEAVKKWKFKPAMLKGKPVAVEVAVEVDFPLWSSKGEQK